MKILFPYLDSNLKVNGGILDKIVLCEHLLGPEKKNGGILNKMRIKYEHVSSDEEIITEYLPRDSNKHCYSVGSAVVSHFAYSTDGNYKNHITTDLFSKYEKLSIDYFKF
jgi:hypothetical protein